MGENIFKLIKANGAGIYIMVITFFCIGQSTYAVEISHQQYSLEECSHLNTGPGQANSFDSGNGYTCCMCPIATYRDKICRPDEPNSTVCTRCTYNSTHRTYVDFEPHAEEKCHLDTVTCAPTMIHVSGSPSSKSTCKCREGLQKVWDLCLPQQQQPLVALMETKAFTSEGKTSKNQKSGVGGRATSVALVPSVTTKDKLAMPTLFAEKLTESDKYGTDPSQVFISMTPDEAVLNLSSIAVSSTHTLGNSTDIDSSIRITGIHKHNPPFVIIIAVGTVISGSGIVALVILITVKACLKRWKDTNTKKIVLHYVACPNNEQMIFHDKYIKEMCDGNFDSKSTAPVNISGDATMLQEKRVLKCEIKKETTLSSITETKQQAPRIPIMKPCKNPSEMTEREKVEDVFSNMVEEITIKDLAEVGRKLLSRNEFEDIYYATYIRFKVEKARMIFGRVMDLEKDLKLENILDAVEGFPYLEEIVNKFSGELRTDGCVD